MDGLHQRGTVEGLGEELVGPHGPGPGPVEQAIARRQHDHTNARESGVLLDQLAGLVTIETRHHHIDEYDPGLSISQARQRVETVHRGHHFAANLLQ